MNNLNNQERNFKSILDDVQIDLDTDAMWDVMEERLPKKRKKIGFFWIFALGLVFSTASVTYLVTISMMDNTRVQMAVSDQVSDIVSNNDMSDDVKIAAKDVDIVTQEEQNQIPYQGHSMIEKDDKGINTLEKPNEVYFKNIKPNGTESKISVNIEKPNEAVTNQVKSTLWPLTHREIELFDINKNLAFAKIDLLKLKPWKSFFNLSSGIHQSVFNYSVENDSKPFFESEKGKVGTSIGIYYGQTHKTGWEWYGGMSFQQSVAGYKYRYDYIDKSKINGVPSIYIDENGDESARIGEVEQVTLVENEKNIYRKHQFFDINLGVAKQLFTIKRMAFKLGTGIGITAFSMHKGYYFNESLDYPVSIQNDKQPYSKSGQFKHFTNASMNYNIHPHYKLGLQMNYTYGLNSIMKNSNFYKLKNSQYGIYFTISYRPY